MSASDLARLPASRSGARGRDFTVQERALIDRIGYSTGCHTCGTKDPGTMWRHFVPDHQPPTARNPLGKPQHLFPSVSRAVGTRVCGSHATEDYYDHVCFEQNCGAERSHTYLRPRWRKHPDLMRGSLIASTPSCVAVGCMADCNGKTEITLGAGREVGLRGAPVFEGELDTPNREIAVRTVLRENILQATVPHLITRVRIWVNHPSEPDKSLLAWIDLM